MQCIQFCYWGTVTRSWVGGCLTTILLHHTHQGLTTIALHCIIQSLYSGKRKSANIELQCFTTDSQWLRGENYHGCMNETYSRCLYRRRTESSHLAMHCCYAEPSFLSNETSSHLPLFLSVFPSVWCCASVISALELTMILILCLLFLERLYLEGKERSSQP